MSNAAAPAHGRFPWLVALLGGFAFVTLLALGTWQVQRLHWKEELLATIEARTHSAPVPLAEIEARYKSTGDVDYTPVTAAGTFHHGGERHFLATWKGRSGFFVYTPLELAAAPGDTRFVFVNRGFVPYDLKDASKRPQGQIGRRGHRHRPCAQPASGKAFFAGPGQRSREEHFLLEGPRRYGGERRA